MKIHIVKEGESLYSIAQKYGVTLDEVIQMNPGIANPNLIDVGMKVKVPSVSVIPGEMEIMHKHSVQQGDTLWKLSKAWGVSLNDMIKANPQLKNPNALLVGEVVNIPKSTTGIGTVNLPETGAALPKWKTLLPKEKVPTAPIAPLPIEKPITAPIVPKVEPLPYVPKIEPLPPVPEKLPKKVYPVQPHIQPPIKPHTDLFKQTKIPATPVMAMPHLPKYPNMPFHSVPNQPMPYGVGPSVLDTANQWPSESMTNIPAANIYPGMTGAPMTAPTVYSTPGAFENQPMGVYGYDNIPMTMPTALENLPMGVHGYENIPMTMPTALENLPMGAHGYENIPMTMPTALENLPMGVHGLGNVPMTMPSYPNIPPSHPGYYPPGYGTPGVHAAGWGTTDAAYPGPMYSQFGPYGATGQLPPMTGTATVQPPRKPCGCHDQRFAVQQETDPAAQETSDPVKKQAARKPVKKTPAKAKVSSKKADRKYGSLPWLNN